MSKRPPSESTHVLFCPFCREAFEGAALCPDHDIELIAFDKLPQAPRPLPAPDETLEVTEFRFGRGLVALGALMTLAGFVGPFAVLEGVETTVWTSSALASSALPSLWTVPIVAGVAIWLLVLRRTLERMRGARLVLPFFALFIPIVVAIDYIKLEKWAEKQGSTLYPIVVTPSWGAILQVVGACVVMIAGFRLGAVRE
jgi:hypothetical protein